MQSFVFKNSFKLYILKKHSRNCIQQIKLSNLINFFFIIFINSVDNMLLNSLKCISKFIIGNKICLVLFDKTKILNI
jgi:hypothetical protein